MNTKNSKYASRGMLGKHHTAVGKENISKAKKGKRVSIKTEFKKGNKPHNTGKPHSLETRMKISLSLGIKKGFITPQNQIIRSSIEYKLWRTAVFERDNYTCIWCGKKNGEGKTIYLNADHIKPFALFPELRFAIDNGRTLCIECHKTTDTYGAKMKKMIGD